MINILFTDVMIMAVINDEFLMVQLHFQWRVSGLFVGSHERRKHTVLLIEENLWFIKLQNDASLHHNHQVCIQDGVHTMLWKHTAPETLFEQHHYKHSIVVMPSDFKYSSQKAA